MNISEKEKGILKRIVTDQAFDLFKEIQEELRLSWTKVPIQADTSFLFAQESLKRQERTEGIKLFLKTLEELCQ